jgi:hypothetical protein
MCEKFFDHMPAQLRLIIESAVNIKNYGLDIFPVNGIGSGHISKFVI